MQSRVVPDSWGLMITTRDDMVLRDTKWYACTITARIILHLISYPQFTYDLFHVHHSPTYLSREHVNPKLTCSQRQWLHSSVGRASHRYREVTGSSPVEVLNFFQASSRNCKNCDHNCEDHSSFDFVSAVHIWFISCASFTKYTVNMFRKSSQIRNLLITLIALRRGVGKEGDPEVRLQGPTIMNWWLK